MGERSIEMTGSPSPYLMNRKNANTIKNINPKKAKKKTGTHTSIDKIAK